MKITHNKVGQNLNVRDNAKTEKSDKAGVTSALDAKDLKAKSADAVSPSEASKVNLSSRAQDIKRIKELAVATPEINEEKVNRLQKMIDEGNYKVDASEIAGKMIDEQASWE